MRPRRGARRRHLALRQRLAIPHGHARPGRGARLRPARRDAARALGRAVQRARDRPAHLRRVRRRHRRLRLDGVQREPRRTADLGPGPWHSRDGGRPRRPVPAHRARPQEHARPNASLLVARRMRLAGAVMGGRALALLSALLVSCTTALPQPSAAPATATPEASAVVSPTPKAIVPIKVRSVTTVGASVIAAGDFAGTKRTEVAVITDPKSDLSVQINVLGKTPDAPGDLWFQTGPGVLSLSRSKFAVMDVDNDGKDDLVALYDGGSNTSKIFVFKSNGAGFTFANVWWTAEDYNWARARYVMSGRFGQDHDTLLIAYQDDGARTRIHALESDGTKLALAGTVYDSGPGKIDLARAKFAVGHFTRAGGPDQIVALYQSEARAKVMLFEPGPGGFTVSDAFSSDVDYDVARSSIAAADTNEDGRDDLVSLYTDADGSAKVHVLDPSASFAPVNGWNGEAALPGGAPCPRSGSLVLGDWNADGRADGLAVAPTATGMRE